LTAAAAAFALGAVAFSGGAQAQCWWTGLSYSCAAPPAAAYAPPVYYPYNTYPTLNYPPSGYKPQWWPSYPGPKPSSGFTR
jgi:hypothetical protein